MRAYLCVMVILMLPLAACSGSAAGYGAAELGPPTPIYIVGHGWHAGIVIRRADLEQGQWPEAQQAFVDAAYLEVGWGDAAYYPDPDPGLGTLLRAGLWPTPSVLHVAGLHRPPSRVFPYSQIIRVQLTPAQLDALVAFIRDEYARGAGRHIVRHGPGLYGTSWFYRGTTRYHVFNNCNHWVARALQAAGQAVHPPRALTLDALLRQVRTVGDIVQPETPAAPG